MPRPSDGLPRQTYIACTRSNDETRQEGDAPCILTANSLGWYTVMFKGGCARARHCALPDRQHQERIPEACKVSTKPLFQLRGGSEVLAAIVWGYRNAAPTTSTASVSWNANLVEPTCTIHEKRHLT